MREQPSGQGQWSRPFPNHGSDHLATWSGAWVRTACNQHVRPGKIVSSCQLLFDTLVVLFGSPAPTLKKGRQRSHVATCCDGMCLLELRILSTSHIL